MAPKRINRMVATLLICLMGLSLLPAASAAGQATKVFTDISQKDWYVKNGAIDYAYNNGLFMGTTPTTFGPNDQMTRAMFVTVLSRVHGVSLNNKVTTRFSDVKKNQYYTGAVKWGSDNGIVAGLSETRFGPDANITREQICALMARYCDYAKITLKKVNAAITFKDAGQISGYAKAAVKACQQGDLVSGEKVAGGYNFRPAGNATRAEVATILMKFCQNYKDKPTDPNIPPVDAELGVGPGTLPDEDANW